MKRIWIRLTVIAVAIVLSGLAFWHWQMKNFSHSLNSIDVQSTQAVALGAMADLVLDESVLRSLLSREGKGILDQHRTSPTGFDERAMFVSTWKSATSLIKAVSEQQIPADTAISSVTLTQAAPNDRVDAWNSPFCVYSFGSRVVVLSSGDGKNQPQCDSLKKIAKRLSKTVTTEKLVKDQTGIYAVVHPMSRS